MRVTIRGAAPDYIPDYTGLRAAPACRGQNFLKISKPGFPWKAGPAGSAAAINKVAACNAGFCVIHAQITGDGVHIQIIADAVGNLAEQAFIHKLLGQLLEGIQLVQINVEVVRLRVLV